MQLLKQQRKNCYFAGDVFNLDGEPHILSQVVGGGYCLISLLDGNRYEDAVVSDDYMFSFNYVERNFVDDSEVFLEYLGTFI